MSKETEIPPFFMDFSGKKISTTSFPLGVSY